MQNFKIEIVEYDPSYAEGIAKMWNNSKEGWNGSSEFQTEESVKKFEEASSHLNLYLALVEDEVVGYCKLAKYFAEEETLYIDLINVLPKYHGQKIGKILMLKAFERTLELGFPRLDLFTWAGNTKAVPLYKKCGFFWEKMETGSTHLMNFLPQVLKLDLLQNFFSAVDWYSDSTRIIETVPDGISKNGFDIYQYSWNKNDKNMLVEFERTSRGISRIETDEFNIELTLRQHQLVFGKNYEAEYLVHNKTDKPLNVSISGLKDKNIKNEIEFCSEITGKEIIKSSFYVNEIEIEQNMWKTHPVVKAEVTIDGQSFILKKGIKPLFPLHMELVCDTGIPLRTFRILSF
ncbi:MAG: GNAT family N-acetyltransferase [Candidatus Cloacimonetes bacterium]|nr:GNAT family N-acetyltransferase [Candidatus Cloacimonadota bacterium]